MCDGTLKEAWSQLSLILRSRVSGVSKDEAGAG